MEYINRARANPVAEAERLATSTDADVLRSLAQWNVVLAVMRLQFSLINPAPPLSINETLTQMARSHTDDMFNRGFQGHGDDDGQAATLATRIANSGYLNGASSYSYGENVFSYSNSVFSGHAAFEVDWGLGVSGMLVPPGHRISIHNADFREIGVGNRIGTNRVGSRAAVGPQLVTQEFGRRGNDAFITGVIFRDQNGNGFYDIGEGVGGVTVNVPGADFYAVSAPSGGYSVPVPIDDTYTVSFSGGGVPDAQRAVTIANGNNAKLDYLPVGSAATSSSLGNISTRVSVQPGDNALIGGFIVTGTQPKKVILRAIGPSLPVNGRLADPTLELIGPGGLIASNDNWRSAQAADIIATTVPPTSELESAIVATLPANGSAYTAIVRGAGGQSGVGLVEIYDLDRTVDSKLANISTRGLVQTGDDVMIGGFIIIGTSPQRVIIRALGPSLPVAGKLADPSLQLVDANGATVSSNDNWRSTQEVEIIATTVPPTNDLESALVATLPPAPHTVVVRGNNNGTGVALVEIYALD